MVLVWESLHHGHSRHKCLLHLLHLLHLPTHVHERIVHLELVVCMGSEGSRRLLAYSDRITGTHGTQCIFCFHHMRCNACCVFALSASVSGPA